ncbi:hypothetical protein LRS14_18700 [Aquincola sp. J276]|nr:hypothetical protein [Aquincola sp. J276]
MRRPWPCSAASRRPPTPCRPPPSTCRKTTPKATTPRPACPRGRCSPGRCRRPEAAWRQVDIAQLAEFFRHPSRALLRRRLGIDLPQAADELQDDEPFVADRAGRQAMAARLLPLLLQGADAATVQALAEAGTEYPPGALGAQQRAAELAQLMQFAAQVREATQQAPLPAQHVHLALDVAGEPWQLQGSFAELRAEGDGWRHYRWHYDNTRPVDYLQAWLPHLLLNVQQPGTVTRVWSRDGSFVLRPVPGAAATLRTLVDLYRQGLQAPLHFFPRTSWAQATGASRSQVEATWRRGPQRPFAEEADAAHRLVLRGLPDPLDEAFMQVADAVYRPLLAALDDPRVTADAKEPA